MAKPAVPQTKKTTMKGAERSAALQKTLQVVSVPIKQIEADENYRVRYENIESLAQSVETYGLLQPIFLRILGKGRYQVVAGERRLRAMRHLKRSHVDARCAEIDDKTFWELKLLENLQREDPHPLETAEGFKRSMDAGSTVEELAHSTGRSVSSIRASLKLLRLSAKGRRLFLAGKLLTESTALYVARIPSTTVQDEFLAKLEEVAARDDGQPPSARWVNEEIHRNYFLDLSKAPFDPKSPDLVKKAGPCSGCPKRTGNDPAFADVKNRDICTDAACWRQKSDASWELQKAQAVSRGHSVLAVKDAAKVFNPYGDGTRGDSEWVSLTEKCYSDPQTRRYQQLLGKVLTSRTDLVAYARHPTTGAVEKLVPKKAVKKLLKEAGHDFQKAGAEALRAANEDFEARQAANPVVQATRLRQEVMRVVLARVVESALTRSVGDLVAFLQRTWDVEELEYADDFWARPGQMPLEELKGALPSLPANEFLVLLVATQIYGAPGRYDYVSGTDDAFVRGLAQAFGMDLDGIQREVAEGRNRSPLPGAPADAPSSQAAGVAPLRCRPKLMPPMAGSTSFRGPLCHLRPLGRRGST
ncbi:ParB/RepB/Spo0J family partition protein (plasmid) [Myxococcus sp. MxC21-1]|uniref:ParB/RepB/Spo0J family partition protein n=1 Tax=Myxococcus sp. MxC21-1 TaxID=3041439 RepID=UPI00293173D4|nr:ParB/RepB/Spo0J family partition protein [Myxococcus sp. MxC21-1]WNZ66216.1 ParB/RepB/Spo0J family partition protein [Myxococcus sp. MxC21-1]